VGFLSGMFGVGGGFLITPLLVVLGIPIDIAVATGANQAVATSASGALVQWQQRNVDLKMGMLLFAGGLVGAVLGVRTLAFLKGAGQVEFVISICYVVLLGFIGGLMLIEGGRAILRTRAGLDLGARRRRHIWLHSLPLKTRFVRSKLYMSTIPPVVLGVAIGVLGALMGVGGGFLAVPVMVYVFGMPTRVVIGTSLFIVLMTSIITTVLQSWENQAVDVVLAVLLMTGGVVGAQFGSRAGYNIPGEQIRAMLGLLVLGVSFRIAADLVVTPSFPFSLDAPRLP